MFYKFETIIIFCLFENNLNNKIKEVIINVYIYIYIKNNN